ncbi:MAG: hypothetical protein R6U96_15315 [Promethearchaeia archaeon]
MNKNDHKEEKKILKNKADQKEDAKGEEVSLQKEEGKRKKNILQKSAKRLRTLHQKTNFSLYLGAGLYEIALGMGSTFLTSFLIALPIVMAYPFLNPTMLWAFKIVGWVIFILGITTCLIPLIKQWLDENSKILTLIWVLAFFNSVILLFLIPIGLFLGLALYQEVRDSGTINKFNLLTGNSRFRYLIIEKLVYILTSILLGLSVGLLIGGNFKLPFMLGPISLFILLPAGLLISVNLRKNLADKYGWKLKEKTVTLYYFLFLFFAGIIHTFLGFLFVFVVPDLLYDAIDLIFPYVTYDTVTFITILGWVNLIPGVILLLSSLWSKKFSSALGEETKSIDLRIIRTLIIISSVILLVVFPIGTFFAIALILEFYYFGKGKAED